MAELLIQKRAGVNLIDDFGNTALYYACENGDYKTAELLIKNGANIDVVNEDGKTPLDIAREKGSDDIVRLLTTQVPVQMSHLSTEGGKKHKTLKWKKRTIRHTLRRSPT